MADMKSGMAILTLSRNAGHVEQLSEALTDQIGGEVTLKVLVNHANSLEVTSAGLSNGWAVVEPGCNGSFSSGNNLAADAAMQAVNPSHLLLLNDDAIPIDTFLGNLWARRDEADVMGALLLEEWDRVNHAGTYFAPDRHVADHLGRGQPRDRWRSSTAPAVQAVTFAAVLIRTELWLQLGGLSERYWYGFEDTDFCLRALKAGAIIRCARDAVALHAECGTRPRGGKADRVNYETFWHTWSAQLPELLRRYAQRIHPEEVQDGTGGS